MEWKAESFGDWKERVSKWHRWFAWIPTFVYARRKVVWLQYIKRRLEKYSGYTGTCYWEYK